MSYFIGNVIFVIVPKVELTQHMLNEIKLDDYVKGNLDKNSLKQSMDGTKYLIKLKSPVCDIFNNYEWLNIEDVRALMRTRDWAEA